MEFLSLLALAQSVCPIGCTLTSSLGALGSFMLVYNGLVFQSIRSRLRHGTSSATAAMDSLSAEQSQLISKLRQVDADEADRLLADLEFRDLTAEKTRLITKELDSAVLRLNGRHEGTRETISVGAMMLGASLFVLLLEKNISVFQPLTWLTCVILFSGFATRLAVTTRPKNIWEVSKLY